jgi:hypothetical protein
MVRRVLAGAGLAAAIALVSPAGALAARNYFTAPFTETTHTPTFGQAPVFVPHTNPQLVVFGEDFKTGEKNQVYIERFDGQLLDGVSEALLANPPGTNAVDIGQNGVGVAPLPLQQRTQIGVFSFRH